MKINKSFFVVLLQLIQTGLAAVTVIYLARLLPADEYGRYVYYLTVASVLPFFTGLGGEHVFLMQGSRERRLIPYLFGTALFIRVVLTALFSSVAALFLFLKDVDQANAILLIIVASLLAVFSNPLFLSFYRVKGIHVRPWIILFSTPLSFIVYLQLLPKSYMSFQGVSLGFFISQVIPFCLFLVDMKGRVRLKVSWRYIRKFSTAGIIFSLSQSLDYVVARLDIFLIQYALGPYALGVYAAGQKLVGLFQLIPSSFHTVELPEFHRASTNKPVLIERFRNLRRLLVELGMLFFGLLIINSNYLVRILFNEQYGKSAGVVVLLSLASILLFLNYPYSMLAEAINKIRERLVGRICAFLITVPFFFMLLKFYGINGAALGMILGQLVFLFFLHWMTRDYNTGLRGLFSDGRSLVIGSLALLVARGIDGVLPDGFRQLVLVSSVYIIIFIGVGFPLRLVHELTGSKIFGFDLLGLWKDKYSSKTSTTLARMELIRTNTPTNGGNGKHRPDDAPWSIVFLMSGRPSPAMLDQAYCAQNLGLKTLMIVFERGEEEWKIDRALVNYEIVTINVPYKTVELKRFTSIPTIYRKAKAIIVKGLKVDGTIMTSSYDLLLFGCLIALGRKYKLRHQVKDLHDLQLSRSFRSCCFVQVEKFLLKRVDRLIVSSPEFVNKYYGNIFPGKTVLLENTPSRLVWADFKRDRTERGCFRIGYIGVMRYKQSLKQLIAAVQILAADNIPIKVVFAGGGGVDDLADEIKEKQLFEFLGPYEYSKDIKRLYGNLDLIYSVYDSNNLNCQIAMPNKFYESIISKIPIIVAKNTFVEEEVLRLGIGTSILSGDVDGLVELLRKAIVNGDWYANALRRLHDCDPNPYFDAYDRAMKESILP